MTNLKRLLYFVGLPLLLVALWWALTQGARNFYVPTPSLLARTFWSVWSGERFGTDLLPSVARLFAGLALSITVGIGAGLFIGSFPQVRSATEPVLEFFTGASQVGATTHAVEAFFEVAGFGMGGVGVRIWDWDLMDKT